MTHDIKDRLIGIFERRVNPGSVQVSHHSFQVHGISNEMLQGEEEFSVIGKELNGFFIKHLEGCDSGILVAHNISTDLRFLCCEMIRAGLTLPKKLPFGLCTYQAIKKLKTAYKTADDADWTEVTATGNRCYSVKCCATYALSQRNPPTQFSIVCGRHHEATADVKAVAVILFDREVFPKTGLTQIIRSYKKYFTY